MSITLHNIDEEYYKAIWYILDNLKISNNQYNNNYIVGYEGSGFRFICKKNNIDVYCII